MSETTISIWVSWARALNQRDWVAWDQLISRDYNHVSFGSNGEQRRIDKAGLREIHESLAERGYHVNIWSVSAIGPMIATTFELVGPDGGSIKDVAILSIDNEGRLLRACDFST